MAQQCSTRTAGRPNALAIDHPAVIEARLAGVIGSAETECAGDMYPFAWGRGIMSKLASYYGLDPIGIYQTKALAH